MKLSKSKLALAKVINENGGWVDDSANWSVQPKHGNGNVWFAISKSKPYSPSGGLGFTFKGQGYWLDSVARFDKVLPNWHQCVLSREEYYQAYPKAYPKADADGWIEFDGYERPSGYFNVVIDVKLECGKEITDSSGRFEWDTKGPSRIIAYRRHKPDVKPEFCESVTLSVSESSKNEKLSPEAVDGAKVALMSESIEESKRKPTIEQLAHDYRNAKEYADRLQKEAYDAAQAADAKLGELELAGEELGLLIGVAKPTPELSITDWRDLKVGDIVFVDEVRGKSEWSSAMVGRECVVIKDGEDYPVCFSNDFTPDGESYWIGGADNGDITWRFIRRP